jgi:hypothetical protein
MPRPFIKVPIRALRSLDCDEKWLQSRLVEDPSILGLGNLTVVERERSIIGGGRLDILLADVGTNTRYEVELMLGALDESHLIRTIEYWDVERRRFPNLKHYAVIVAEDITSRFLNVIALLNKSVPLIALQMSAMDLDGKVGLTFVKVLDLAQTFDELEEDKPKGQISRKDWEEDGYSEALTVVDAIADLLRAKNFEPQITYTQGYVAINTGGKNFAWAYPKKLSGRCYCTFKVLSEETEKWLERLSSLDLIEITHDRDSVKMNLTKSTLASHIAILGELILYSELQSHR